MKSAVSLTLAAALVTSVGPVAAQVRIDSGGGPIQRTTVNAAIRMATEPVAVAAGQSGQVGREDVVSQSTPAAEQCRKASPIASSFEMLQAIVKTGDVLLVRDASGRKIKGTLRGLSGGSLDLLEWDNGQGRRLSEVDVREIEIECPDPLWNGALIGAAVTGSFLFLAASGPGPSGYSTAELWGAVAGYVGFGAAVGAFVDSKKRDTITIYSAPAQRASRLQIAPLLSKSRAGVRVAVRF